MEVYIWKNCRNIYGKYMRTSPKEMEVHSRDNPLSIYQWHFLLERILPIFILNLSSLIPITVVHGWWMVKSCWIPLFLLANWGKEWPALRGATVEHWHGGGPRVSPAAENCCRGDFGLIPKRVNFDPNFACKSCWSLGKKNWCRSFIKSSLFKVSTPAISDSFRMEKISS